MGKTKVTNEEQNAQDVPAFAKELLEKGTVVLKAKTREELAEMVNEIPADCKFAASVIGYSYETDLFTLRVDKV